MRITRIISTIVSCSAFALPLLAQTPAAPAAPNTKVAYVVAVVGDSVITSAFLLDAMTRRVQELKQQGRPVPTENDTAEIRSLQDTLIADRIADLVILQAISRDTSYKVNEEVLTSALEDKFAKLQADRGGPVAFNQALKESGLTQQEYRNLLLGQMRTDELYKQFKDRAQQKRQAPKATQKEIEAFFPAWQAARGPRPAMVTYQQVVVRVQPSDTALARAKALADSIYQVVIKNRDAFPDLAKKFSDDAGTKDKGGEFGWFVQDEVAKEFGRAAFAAPVGTITPPVRTEFGYHIIDVERHRGAQVQARHILISATITPEDIARAQARADSATAKLRAGAKIEDVIKQYGDPSEDLTVANADPTQVVTHFGIDLTKAAKGDVVGPASTPPGPGQLFTIARVTDASPAGSWSLTDPGVQDNIRSIIESQKLLDEVLAELKRDTYIEIRPH